MTLARHGLVTADPDPDATRVMLFAAGRGERMGERTNHCPKPLLDVAGRPLIAHALERIAAAGYRDVTVNVAWLGEQIVDWLALHAPETLRIRVSQEPAGALETAGGILHALFDDGTQLQSPEALREWFLVVNADVLCDHPLTPPPAIQGSHHDQLQEPVPRHGRGSTGPEPDSTEANAGLTTRARTPIPSRTTPTGLTPDAFGTGGAPLGHLVVVPNPRHHPGGDFLLSQDGMLLPQSTTTPNTASAAGLPSVTYSGIGWLRGALFEGLVPGRAALGPLLHRAAAAGRLQGSLHRGAWIDVGTPERLAEADRLLRAH